MAQTVKLINNSGHEHEVSHAYALNILRLDQSQRGSNKWKVAPSEKWKYEANELVRIKLKPANRASKDIKEQGGD